jgi:Glycine/D-amino acid oxidases (deaminating)
MSSDHVNTRANPERTDRIVIIGGGVIGLTTAFILARYGKADGHEYDVQLIEREETLGSRSTTAAGCGFRTVYQNPVNIALSKRGMDFWTEAETLLGGSIGLRRNGYVFLTGEQDTETIFERETARQTANGIPAEYASPPVFPDVLQLIDEDRYTATLSSPRAALASPHQIVETVAQAAADEGVTLRTGSSVTDLTPTADGVRVEVDGEPEHADIAVNAAGAWANRIAQLADDELPITIDRRRLSTFDATVSREAPLSVDVDSGAYLLPRADGKLHAGGRFEHTDGVSGPDDDESFLTDIDPDYTDRLRSHAAQLYEPLEDAKILKSWTGLYTMTEDHVPIIDKHRNLVHVTGFSGHGIMQAPAAGMVVSRLIDSNSDPTVSAKSLSRDRTPAVADIQF